MAILRKEERTQITPGLYQAVLTKVTLINNDFGSQSLQWYFQLTIPGEVEKRQISGFTRPTIVPGSVADSWFQAIGFDLELGQELDTDAISNVPCLVVIANKQRKDGTIKPTVAGLSAAPTQPLNPARPAPRPAPRPAAQPAQAQAPAQRPRVPGVAAHSRGPAQVSPPATRAPAARGPIPADPALDAASIENQFQELVDDLPATVGEDEDKFSV